MRRYFLFWLLAIAPLANANVVGTDAQNFNTTTGGLDFVTVQSSETLDPGVLNLGFFSSYARNTFGYLGLNAQDGGGKASDSMLMTDFNFGIGLSKNWDAGISFPYLAASEDNSGQDRVILRDSGMTEVRMNTKYRLSGDDKGGFAVIGSVNWGLISNNPYAGQGAGATYNLEFAADTTIRKIGLGANIGYRARTPGRRIATFSEIEPRGDQIIASGAASYLIGGADTKIIGEIFSAWPTANKSLSTDRSQQTLEWLGGIKHDFSSNVAFHLGGGTRLANGIASPDWRVYAGVNCVLGPLWGDPKPLIRKVNPEFSYPSAITTKEVERSYWTAPTETRESFVADEILFGFGSDKIVNAGAKEALGHLADHIERPPRYKMVIIEGHTDSIGGTKFNRDLSYRRASNMRKYLIEAGGLDPLRVKAVGYGETRPIADNGNYQGRAKNRRVEFKVYREGSRVPEELSP